MKNIKIGAIVLGGHVQGYGIIRLLGEEQIASVVIDATKINIARHSKYCKMSYVCPYDRLLDLLFGFIKHNLYEHWIVIPTDDYYVRLLSKHYNELNSYFHLLVDQWDVIEIFFNKCKTYPWIKDLEIPVPLTYYPHVVDEIWEVSQKMNYPCIIKPAIMKDFYEIFGSKVIVCNSKRELIANYNRVIKSIPPAEIMIQEIIPGNCENQFSIGMFCVSGKIFNSITARRKRQHPLDFGNATTYAETVEIPVLLEYAELIMQNCMYTGVCEVEFKYDPKSQEYKFLEVNPRFWKWHLLAEAAGVPLVKSVYDYFTAGETVIYGKLRESSWQDIVTDVPTILNMAYRKVYVKPVRSKKINAVANFKDIKPFVMQIIYLPYLVITRK